MTHALHAHRYCPHSHGEPVSKKIDDILAIIDGAVPREQHYDCEGCGRTHVLRPDTSMRAKVECACGERCEFNLGRDA